jgi:hypothetical protein
MSHYSKSSTKDFEILKNNIPQIIQEVNRYLEKRRILEADCWGLNNDIKLVDLFSSSAESQLTMDVTKEFQSVWTKSIRKVLSMYLKNNNFKEGDHYDIMLDNEEYEIKTTSAFKNKEWSGNKFSINKVGKHILIKYKIGDYSIEEIGIYVIDLNCCTNTKWVPGSSKGTSFSVLKIHVDDINCVQSLCGDFIKEKRSPKWGTPKLKKIL